MKIFHFIPSLSKGGAEGFLFRLAYEQSKKYRDYEIIILTILKGNYYNKYLLNKNVKIFSLNLENKLLVLFNFYKIYKIIKVCKPDVVITWMYHCNLIGGMISKLLGIKNIIWSIRHTNLVLFNSKFNTIFIDYLCVAFSYFIPNKIIYCSHQSKIIHERKLYNSKISKVIFNGYSHKDFQINQYPRLEYIKKNNFKKDHLFISMIARYSPQKNHKLLIESLGLYKRFDHNFTLILAGKGVDENNSVLVSLLKKNNIYNNVLLLGHFEDVKYIYNLTDLTILTSSYGESFPNTLAESMLCGNFCISADIGESKLIIGKYGIVKDNLNSFTLSKTIIENKNTILDFKIKEARRNHILLKFNIINISEKYRALLN